jgi:hypothetical protein
MKLFSNKTKCVINDEQMFQSLYSENHYIIPKRLSQDVVESFFSANAVLWGYKQYDCIHIRI